MLLLFFPVSDSNILKRFTFSSHETLQWTVDYIGIGITDIHTMEHCYFTGIYYERWDPVEDMSEPLKGSN